MCDHCGCNSNNHPGQSGETSTHRVELEHDVLAHDRKHAEALRGKLSAQGSPLINVIGSPGSGKTELLATLIPKLMKRNIQTVVIEGDLATDNDAKRIAKAGAPAYQVTTGTACHLTAHDVEHAISHLDVPRGALIVVENVGNLVCPSMFDIGESLRIVCLSVTEGTDKPQKYPVSFREANIAVLTKCDLLPYVDFHVEESTKMMHQIKPKLDIVLTSAKSELGLEELAEHIAQLYRRMP